MINFYRQLIILLFLNLHLHKMSCKVHVNSVGHPVLEIEMNKDGRMHCAASGCTGWPIEQVASC